MRKIRGLAQNSLRMGDTYSALIYYKEWAKRKPENAKVILQLAELYRNARDYEHSADAYWNYLKLTGGQNNQMALFHAGNMFMQTGKYEEARSNFIKFKRYAKQMDDLWYRRITEYRIAGCELAISLRDSVKKAEVQHLNQSINKAHIEFSPIPMDENTLIYGSLMSDQVEFYDMEELDTADLPKRKFYLAKKEGDEWKSAGEFNEPVGETNIHVGNGALSPDGNRFYFTKCQENFIGKTICHLWYSEKVNGKWGEPIEMDDAINLSNYTTTQPTVGRESKRNQEVIYFVSDRPEGKGGLDIWFTEYHARTKRFRAPQNAGASVNTPGDEFTPYYDVSTHSLYFSSDGRKGLGGLDVYKIEGEKTRWSKDSLQHLGKEINSPADDFDFILNKDRNSGFLVSNREGGVALLNATCCDDIYSFKFVEYVNVHLDGLVIDSSDCLDDVDVLLYLRDEDSGEKYLAEELRVNPCNFSFTLEPDRDYIIEAKKVGYFNDVVDVTTKNRTPADTLNVELQLNKIPKKPIVLEGILYDFDSANLTASAKESLDTGLYPIMVENPQIIIELSSHTDSKGSDAYNLKLSDERAQSVVDYMIEKGIMTKRLKAKGYGETKPIASNTKEDGSDNPEGRALNRRTEFEIIGELSEDEYLPEQD